MDTEQAKIGKVRACWRALWGCFPEQGELPTVRPVQQALTKISIKELTDKRAPVAKVLSALLGCQALPMPADLIPTAPSLSGRQWWNLPWYQQLADTEAQQQWETLLTEGTVGEVISWLEIARCSEVTRLFTEALLKFQSSEILCTEHDCFPYPWGPTAYQAAVAAYNTIWLAFAYQHGAPSAYVQPVQQALTYWLENTQQLAKSTSGDFVILHLLVEGLSRVTGQLTSIRDRIKNDYIAKGDQVEFWRKRHAWAWLFFPRRYDVRRHAIQAMTDRQTVREIFDDTATAVEKMQNVHSRWRILSPMTQLLHTDAAPEDTVSAQIGPLAADPVAKGLQDWLIRRMVRGSTPPLPSPAGLPLVTRLLHSAMPDDHRLDPADTAWDARRFVLRFYRLWELTTREWLRNRTHNEAPALFREFFAPWERLRNASQVVLRHPVGPGLLPIARFRLAFEENDPEDLPPSPAGERLPDYFDRLNTIRDGLTNTLRPIVATEARGNADDLLTVP